MGCNTQYCWNGWFPQSWYIDLTNPNQKTKQAFYRNWENYSKIHMEMQIYKTAKTASKKNNIGKLKLPIFKIYYNNRVIKIV